jgi:hypothetical protein
MIWFLTQMHHHFQHKVILVWDRYSVHRAAARYFQRHHPGWFQGNRTLTAYGLTIA